MSKVNSVKALRAKKGTSPIKGSSYYRLRTTTEQWWIKKTTAKINLNSVFKE